MPYQTLVGRGSHTALGARLASRWKEASSDNRNMFCSLASVVRPAISNTFGVGLRGDRGRGADGTYAGDEDDLESRTCIHESLNLILIEQHVMKSKYQIYFHTLTLINYGRFLRDKCQPCVFIRYCCKHEVMPSHENFFSWITGTR